MKITTVLFDLDGTLLPMDQNVFIKAHFGGLASLYLLFFFFSLTLSETKNLWR